MIFRQKFLQILMYGHILIMYGCAANAYPEERFIFDPDFFSFFNSVISTDTIHFVTTGNGKKTLILRNVDSTIRNKKGRFINEAPYKRLRANFTLIGTDTISLERENSIEIGIDPKTLKNGITIQFGDLYYGDSQLPHLQKNIIKQNGIEISNFYFIKTRLKTANNQSVDELYITPGKGFIAFKTVDGRIWLRHYKKENKGYIDKALK